MQYIHLDVFSKIKFSGNSLTVFFPEDKVESLMMQVITQEMRHFESIFLFPVNELHDEYNVKIYTLEEELDFAGHPLIGAACAVHSKYFSDYPKAKIKFNLNKKSLFIYTEKNINSYLGTMEQGIPEFISTISPEMMNIFLNEFNLTISNLTNLPMEVISTGLSYLIVPLKSGIEEVRHKNISGLLSKVGAKFVYFYDVLKNEGRTWDNEGIIEDIATGSAAGPVAAYLVKHKLKNYNEVMTINQGRFLNRASQINVIVYGNNNIITNIDVIGSSTIVGRGEIYN